jgi:hypothetical protein
MPHTQSAVARQGLIDQIVEYCSSVYGGSDTIDAICYGAQYLQQLPLSSSKVQVLRRLSGALDRAGSTFYLLDTIADGTKLWRSSSELSSRLNAQNVKKLTYDGLTVIADVGESAKYLLSVIGRAIPNPVKVLTNSAWLYTDVVDLKEELHQWLIPSPTEGPVRGKEANVLFFKTVKTTSSLAMDILGNIAVASTLVSSSALTGHLFLLLSSVFLVMNITIHFFNKSIQADRAT